MLFTVVPIEDVFEGMEQEPVPTVEMAVGGITMELEMMGHFQAKVVRIISTNPQDYLLAQYAPGSLVSWT